MRTWESLISLLDGSDCELASLLHSFLILISLGLPCNLSFLLHPFLDQIILGMGELFCHFKMLTRFLPQAALSIAVVTGIHPLTLGSAVAQISRFWFCYLVPKLQTFGGWESILGRWWYIRALFPSSFLGICCWTAREWATCTKPITPDTGLEWSALDGKLNS